VSLYRLRKLGDLISVLGGQESACQLMGVSVTELHRQGGGRALGDMPDSFRRKALMRLIDTIGEARDRA